LNRKSRKFLPQDDFNKEGENYFLLPFRFININKHKELLVNDVGDYIISDIGTARKVVNREIDKSGSLYADLISKFFISEKDIPELIDIQATRYRTKKSFLDEFTALHIFVITLRCDHTCHYCQVSRQTSNKSKYDMSKKNLDRSIDLMFKSPSKHITMEFQGGEPLLAFDNVKYAIERADKLSKTNNKEITFVICTNLASITEEQLHFCKDHEVLISTSYDGPKFIHDSNRNFSKGSSHEVVTKKIDLVRKILGEDQISALMTTTNLTLQYPIEIIDDYLAMGFNNIFLRPISPYGFAIKNEKKNKYEIENFIDFYIKGLSHIIDINRKGRFFSEDYSTIILSKILTPLPVGYVDLQSPSGAINSAIVYNYNGFVYASDESRMLAEMSDETFNLGHVKDNSYNQIFYGEKSKNIAKYSCNEALPGCSECGFQTFCGADPIYNHATQGDMTGYRPTNGFCKKNMDIMRYLFNLISDDNDIMGIFTNWVHKGKYDFELRNEA